MPCLARSIGRTVCVGILSATPLVVSAQSLQRDQRAHAQYLALNVVIGATASVARAVVSGAPIRVALAKGLLGGSLMGGGMELIGTESRTTRFAGLQTHGGWCQHCPQRGRRRATAVGRDSAPLSALPQSTAAVVDADYSRVSVMSAAKLASVVTGGSRPRIDWMETVATGAPVFRSPRWRLPSASCPPPCEGSFAQHNAGVVIYSASAGSDYDLQRSLAHESLHLAQQTRDAVLDAIPASDAALARFGNGGRTISRFSSSMC